MTVPVEVVNAQAVELERRMLAADASIVIRVVRDQTRAMWSVCLSRPGVLDVDAQGPSLSATLWACCMCAGLTEGLVAP
jgi:hypothetical protein